MLYELDCIVFFLTNKEHKQKGEYAFVSLFI